MSTPAPIQVILIGGGGHGRVLQEITRGCSDLSIAGILDQNKALWGTQIAGVAVWGGDDQLPAVRTRGISHFLNGIGSAGPTERRARLYDQAVGEGLVPVSLRHSTAWLAESAQLGPGSQLLIRSVINTGAILGANVLVNNGAIIDHDTVIGDHCHIAIGALLGGNVTLGRGVHVGAGAVIREGIHIGDGAIIAAGAVVVAPVAPGQTVMGVPAKPKAT